MAAGRGRGRGRGRGAGLSFNVELLGFARGEALPAPTLQPPPTYPPLDFKPAPLAIGTESEYLVALRQELLDSFKSSEFFKDSPKLSESEDIERYSDKFRQSQIGRVANFDFSYFPKELDFRGKKSSKPKAKPKLKPNIKTPTTKKNIEEISKKLEVLEAGEGNESEDENKDDNKEKQDEENEDQEEELEEDEDLQEEETDYASNYFDNGENYLDEEDDNLDEPTY